MHKRFIATSIFLLLITGYCVSAYSDDKPIETYSATLTSLDSAKGPTRVTIRILSYTPDEEVAKLANLLKTKGQYEVNKEIWNVVRGHIAPVGGLGIDLNYIRAFNTDKGKMIRLVSSRQMSFLEMKINGRSTDYPFSIVELTFLDNGKIEGSIIGAAKVELSQDNVLNVESYGSDRLRLINISKTK